MSQQWQGRHWRTGQSIAVTVRDGVIADIKPCSDTEPWIAPGLIDVQVNGAGGFNFNGPDAAPETVENVVRILHSHGVTRFCPTVTTATKDSILRSIRAITVACEQNSLVNHAVLGIHVEGPFISAEAGPRGAHNSEWTRDPDWQEFLDWQEAAKGRVVMVTLAPERPGAIDFIKELSKSGVIAALGHTAANEAQILAAVKAGASMSTHLGNGAHPYIKRHPNYIWSQLANDQLWAGLIGDGFHLPASTLKVMMQAKRDKAILVSDASYLAGMPSGEYTTHHHVKVVLESNGRLHLKATPDILSGAAMLLDTCVQNLVNMGVASIAEAIEMAATRPAQLLGSKDGGSIDINNCADFFLYRWLDDGPGGTLQICETVTAGNTVYKNE
ncbi:hypothetical protein AXX12_08935 [Anaerosporomusa subterranea]|uniref:Amidohydrolase-related domain-containing protein n=1 Tax=Anaerosporomusa subterranea TaxID=1794912 RepID=A0A154BRQ0_ANASB|nr:amidohydrolase family protein [Anaerosporomusa subterranea]KYZ76545.1 hypothetical protein AXX12_08935 [Anaerosporomusa subterranea]